MSQQHRSIGLLLLFNLPDNEKAALLRVRGRIDPQTGKSESFAGVSQVTVHGEVNPGEDMEQALRREIIEELGEMLRMSGMHRVPHDLYKALLLWLPTITELAHNKRQGRTIITLGGLIQDPAIVDYLRPLMRTYQLRLVRASDIPTIESIDITDESQRDKQIPDGDIVMFPDELAALKHAFEHVFV